MLVWYAWVVKLYPQIASFACCERDRGHRLSAFAVLFVCVVMLFLLSGFTSIADSVVICAARIELVTDNCRSTPDPEKYMYP